MVRLEVACVCACVHACLHSELGLVAVCACVRACVCTCECLHGDPGPVAELTYARAGGWGGVGQGDICI